MNTSTAAPAAGEGAAAATVTARQPRGSRPHNKKKNLAPLWMLSPAGLVMLALVAAPIIYLVVLSFTDTDRKTLFTGEYSIVGFAQYQKIFEDPQFWAALVRTVLFTAVMVLATIVVGMWVSQMLTRLGTIMRYVVTVILIFAWGMPTVASSQVWKWLFQPGYGIVNWLLTQLRVFGDMTSTSWANNVWLGLTCILLLIVWQGVPFIGLTLYAAQTQIAPEYYEAARLDGASERRIYWTITLNFLKPTLLLVTVLSIIWDFNVFNQIWLITQGGPDNGTTTLGIWSFKKAFVSFDIGQGAAISVVTTILLMLFTGVYIRRLLRSGEDL
jgi:N,N'-diacetylchitobiose transport system permease protein